MLAKLPGKGNFYAVGGNLNSCNHCGNRYGEFSELQLEPGVVAQTYKRSPQETEAGRSS